MQSQIHHFRASAPPTEKHIHCLWNTVTDKQYNNKNPAFKIVLNGKLVAITTSLALNLDDVLLRDNTFSYLRSSIVQGTSIEAGATVHAQGNICYSVHQTQQSKNRDVCPVEFDGTIRKDMRQHFLEYLTKSIGLDFEKAYQARTLNFSREDRSVGYEDKVRLNDILLFDITGVVINADTVNALPLNAVGKRKSYGFGNVIVNN